MAIVLAVAAGGAVGAVSRYALSSVVTEVVGLRGAGTVVANLVGAFLLGAVIGLTEERWELSETVRNGITVGVLGGFTTFSTYMWDVIYHAEDERWFTGGALLVVTVVLGLAAMLGGLAAGRAA